MSYPDIGSGGDMHLSNSPPRGGVQMAGDFDPVRHMEAVANSVAQMNKKDAGEAADRTLKKIKENVGVK